MQRLSVANTALECAEGVLAVDEDGVVVGVETDDECVEGHGNRGVWPDSAKASSGTVGE